MEDDRVKRKMRKTVLFLALLAAAIMVATVAWLVIENGYLQAIKNFIDSDISPLLFVILTIILPLLGFPISLFLVIAGIKFGVFLTCLLWLLVLPVHTTISYVAAKSLRPMLLRLLEEKLGYSLPVVPDNRKAVFSLLFYAMPGLPYAAKNYLLPLAGLEFRYCVVMNSVVQSLLGLPFIILGKSGAEGNSTLFYAALLALIVLVACLRLLKKRFGQN